MAAIARQVALSVLNALDDPHVTLDRLLAQAFEKEPRPIQRDRALANELVFGVLRWRARLDWVIKDLSKTPMHRIDGPVLNIIRLGLYQILFLSRIPVSAAVNDAVELTKGKAPAWTVRFVNAVLRTAVRRAQDIPWPREEDDPVSAIAIGESHPPWMVKRWVKRLGVGETKRLCKANNAIPPVTIRANTLKVSRERLHRSLVAHVKKIRQTRFAPEGLALTGLKKPIDQVSPFQRGWFQVQDEAAQLVTYLLDPKGGETVLDACAGLGGKTGHIAQLMKDSGVLRAMDREAWKLRALRTAMKRLGISTVTTWHHDLSSPLPENLSCPFDRILVDAPCSGLGVIRRNPDMKWKKREEDLLRLQRRQSRLLAALAPLVKRGGWLVYCVCSLEPEEGDEVVDAFLKSHRDFAISRSPCQLPDMNQQVVDRSGIFKTVPSQHNMDGFFAVRFKKAGP
ncbi:MAG: 16S rRNA (cytosine(967)-C(5))-methyltransferase RsmB [Thermodesulfobacteriota bacterium]|nr:16S rRNA (cytosine(967)-C(5))-methyltransferase RsmB [Thermodesulfobacteriota bacterium]